MFVFNGENKRATHWDVFIYITNIQLTVVEYIYITFDLGFFSLIGKTKYTFRKSTLFIL